MTATTGHAKYQQVADDLRAKIAADVYGVGSELPSATQLMKLYDVSSTVIKSAIKELKIDGLIEGQSGKGVYVLRKPDSPEASAEYREVIQQIAALREGFATTVQSIQDRLTAIEKSLTQVQAGQQARPRTK